MSVDVGIRYVAELGDDENDGLSWEAAKATVGQAVESLPIVGSASWHQRHAGKVMVGAGVFDEPDEIEFNADLHIEGVGSGLGGTIIRRAHEGHLFAPSTAFTDWGHHLRLSALKLEGNASTHPEPADLVRIYRSGFNTAFYDVLVRNSTRHGIKLVDHAVNFHGYNLTGAHNAETFLHLNLVLTANLANVGLFGTQVDNSGTPIVVESAAAGDANHVGIYGLETEGPHDHVVEHRRAGNANPVHYTIDGVTAFNAEGGEAVLYETAAASGARGKWVLRNIHGSGYEKAWKSAQLATSSTSNHIYREEFL